MKYAIFIFILLIAGFNGVAHSQNVVKRIKNYISINIDETTGYKIGDSINIYRSIDGESVFIGNAKIVQFRHSKCALEVVSENPTIKVGDFMEPFNDFTIDDFSSSNYSQRNIYNKKRNHTLTYLTISAGIIVSAISYDFHNRTVQTYDDYKIASTSQEATRLYNEAEKDNNYSKISLGVGGGLFLFALINELFLKPSPRKPNQFSVRPCITKKTVGLSCNF